MVPVSSFVFVATTSPSPTCVASLSSMQASRSATFCGVQRLDRGYLDPNQFCVLGRWVMMSVDVAGEPLGRFVPSPFMSSSTFSGFGFLVVPARLPNLFGCFAETLSSNVVCEAGAFAYAATAAASTTSATAAAPIDYMDSAFSPRRCDESWDSET